MTTDPRTAPDPAVDDRPPGWRRRGARIGAVALAFALGVGISQIAGNQGGTSSGLPGVGAFDATAGGDPVEAGDGVLAADEVPLPADATTPQAAVLGFLNAEASGDFDASYGYLSAADRSRYSTVALWRAEHARILPVSGFRVDGDATLEDGSPAVATSLRLPSRLDPVLGLIPARASARWGVVEEDGGWRVAFEPSVVLAQYPDDDGVTTAALDWFDAQQACDAEPVRHGVLVLAEEICGTTGGVEAGEVRALGSDGVVSGLVTAFGAEANVWARVVPLRGAADIDVVLAPVDDRWSVVAVVPPR